MDEAKERGKAPPTGEGVVLLQSTYRHPVQTTLVPHTNVCTYVCGDTRVFPVRALDPGAPPSFPTVVVVVVLLLVVVVVPLLIIRMMGRHTLELKLRDVSSVVEIRARARHPAPLRSGHPCRFLVVYEREGRLYIRLPLVERDCENTSADNTAEDRHAQGDSVSSFKRGGFREAAKDHRHVVVVEVVALTAGNRARRRKTEVLGRGVEGTSMQSAKL